MKTSNEPKKKKKTQLIHMSLPLPFGLGEEEMVTNIPSNSSGTPTARKKKNLVATIAIILSGFFASAGLIAFSSIGGILTGFLSSFFASITGWDMLTLTLFLTGLFWFIAAVLYVKHKASSDITQKIDDEVFNRYYKYENVDLSRISIQQLALELQNKGCHIFERNLNTQIVCSEELLLQKIKSADTKNITTQKFVAITVAIIVAIVFVIAYFYGMFAFLGTLDWLILLLGFGIVGFLLLNANVIKLWHVIVILVVPIMIMFLLGLIDPSYLWIVVGVCSGLIILVGVLYYLRKNLCDRESWICDFL